MGMSPFLTGMQALVFVYRDVLEARIALEVANTQRVGFQDPFDFLVAELGKRASMIRRLDDDLVRADKIHTIVNAFGGAARFAFDTVERAKVRQGPNLPRTLARE